MKTLIERFENHFKQECLRQACLWLDKNHCAWTGKYTSFCYPEFCGMPEELSMNLDCYDADWIQDHILPEDFKS